MKRPFLLNETALDVFQQNADARRVVEFAQSGAKNPATAEQLFENILPGMQIQVVQDKSAMPYLHCGASSTTARVFGQDFAVNAIGENGIPDSIFENVLRDAYMDIYEGVYDSLAQEVYASLKVGPKLLPVHYFRLLFPVEFTSFKAVGVACFFSHELY